MLPSLGFEGTAKVINKGVDVTLLADASGAQELFQISRHLVVCGFSAAVVAVTETDPVDMRTIRYYEDTTPLLIFFDKSVAKAVIPHLQPETKYTEMDYCPAAELMKKLPALIKG
jgi:pyruvate/2-oxoglutarate/acetoin dehydrogenase E1 component